MDFVHSKMALARELEISYDTMLRYFKEPGHPASHLQNGTYNVKAWREWATLRYGSRQNGSNPINVIERPVLITSEREKAITEKNKLEVERARFRLRVETGEYLPRQDVCNQVETAHSTVRRELNKVLLHEMPPRLEGLKAMEMKRPIRHLIDELSDQLVQKLLGYAGEAADNATG